MHSESEAIGIIVTLLDGTIDGRYEYRLDSWNIDIYKIPHKLLKESDNYKMLHTPGVYLLFGEKTTGGAPFVYVGEAEDIYVRLNQKHTFEKGANKEVWDDAIILVALSAGDLDKAKIKYLEGRFYEIALEAKRFVVKNGNTPKISQLSKQNKNAMENLIKKAKLVLPTTGYDVFTAKSNLGKAPKVQPQPKPIKKQSKKSTLGADEKKGNTPMVCNMTQETFKKFETNGRGKDNIVKELFDEWGIDYDQNVNFAKYMSRRKYYWMNPSGGVLSKDWTIVLFNTDTLIITVMRVPKGSLSVSKDGLKVRNDPSKPGYLDLVFLDSSFIEKQSKVDFSKYITDVIKVKI